MNNPFIEEDNSNNNIEYKLTITNDAINRLKKIFAEEKNKVFRIIVSGGGCSGFQYKFDIDKKFDKEKDFTIKIDEITVAIDKKSLEFINNGEVDFINSLTGQYFTINNPNAKSSCGCGTSFSV
ncbi:MAG: HesB/IscA family protein [Alphaproteobacteria bacterium]|jgi:iron-sulfur cluster insertion protein